MKVVLERTRVSQQLNVLNNKGAGLGGAWMPELRKNGRSMVFTFKVEMRINSAITWE